MPLTISLPEETSDDPVIEQSPIRDEILEEFEGIQIAMPFNFQLTEEFKACILAIYTTPQNDPSLNGHKQKFKELIGNAIGEFKEKIKAELHRKLDVFFPKKDPSEQEKYLELFESFISVQLLLNGNHLEEIIKNTLDAMASQQLESISSAPFVPFEISITSKDGVVATSIRDFGKGFPPPYIPDGSYKERPYTEARAERDEAKGGRGSEKKGIDIKGSLGGAGKGIKLAAAQADGFNDGIVTISNHKEGGAVVTFKAPTNPTINQNTELGRQHKNVNQNAYRIFTDAVQKIALSDKGLGVDDEEVIIPTPTKEGLASEQLAKARVPIATLLKHSIYNREKDVPQGAELEEDLNNKPISPSKGS